MIFRVVLEDDYARVTQRVQDAIGFSGYQFSPQTATAFLDDASDAVAVVSHFGVNEGLFNQRFYWVITQFHGSTTSWPRLAKALSTYFVGRGDGDDWLLFQLQNNPLGTYTQSKLALSPLTIKEETFSSVKFQTVLDVFGSVV